MGGLGRGVTLCISLSTDGIIRGTKSVIEDAGAPEASSTAEEGMSAGLQEAPGARALDGTPGVALGVSK
jgi:hypothetical protein